MCRGVYVATAMAEGAAVDTRTVVGMGAGMGAAHATIKPNAKIVTNQEMKFFKAVDCGLLWQIERGILRRTA